MAWLKVDETLCDHPKVLALADSLKLDKDTVTGKLLRLWTWALNNREDGILARRDAETVSEVMRFKGKAQRLMDALVAARFLDETDDGWRIHDWADYAGNYVEKRAQTAERVKKHRQLKRQCNAPEPAEESPASSVTSALHERYNGVTVTPLEKDREKEKDIYTTATAANTRAHACESDPSELRDGQYAALIDAYTQNIRMPSAIEAESIEQWLSDMPAEVIDFAIKQAALSGIRSWRGVETILLRWKEIGVHDLPSAQAAQREWSNRVQAQPRAAPRPQGTLGRAMSNLDALMAQTLEEEHGRYHQS
jgi:DnaD/phage-associated family protein